MNLETDEGLDLETSLLGMSIKLDILTMVLSKWSISFPEYSLDLRHVISIKRALDCQQDCLVVKLKGV